MCVLHACHCLQVPNTVQIFYPLFLTSFLTVKENEILQVMLQNVTRLCHTRSIVTVNGKFPGPRIVAREGDRLLIKVVNHVPNNISIHWYIYMDWSPSIPSKYSEPYIEKAESKSLSTISLIQAWNPAASKRVG